jgi:hypothetical protein
LGQVIQNLKFDDFGHVTLRDTINLDTRYSLLNHFHSLLTNGLGLTGSNYNGTVATTWNVDFAGSGTNNTASRSDHTHDGGVGVIITYYGTLGQIYGDWDATSWMKQVQFDNGLVILWGYLIKNGNSPTATPVNINSANPYPPTNTVLLTVPLSGTLDGLGTVPNKHKIFTVNSSGLTSITGPLLDKEYFYFSLTYYIH